MSFVLFLSIGFIFGENSRVFALRGSELSPPESQCFGIDCLGKLKKTIPPSGTSSQVCSDQKSPQQDRRHRRALKARWDAPDYHPNGRPGEEGETGGGGFGPDSESSSSGDLSMSENEDDIEGHVASNEQEADSVTPSPPVDGAPADPNQAFQLQRPQHFTNLFQQTATKFKQVLSTKSAFFWSSGGKRNTPGADYYNLAKIYGQDSRNNLMNVEQLWDAIDRSDTESLMVVNSKDSDVQNEAGVILSAAMANAAEGEVHLMIPMDGLNEKTTWTTFEWPEIIREGNSVTQITHLDPNTGLPGAVLWRREDGFTGEWPLGSGPSNGFLFPLGNPALGLRKRNK